MRYPTHPTPCATDRSSSPATTGDLGHLGAWGHEEHTHDEHQLIFLSSGQARVTVRGRQHLLTPYVALWLPAATPHAARFSEDAVVLPLLVPEPLALPALGTVTEVSVTGPLRTVLLATLREAVFGTLTDTHVERVRTVLVASLHALPAVTLPTDTAARHIALALLDEPGTDRTLAEWAHELFVSEATIRRAFRTETGLTFSQWRTLARVRAGAELLDRGVKVQTVAARVGFTSTNGFILAFRRHFGYTPGTRSTAVPHVARVV